MSEESTKVVRTVATVSVRPAATPQEANPEHLTRMVVHCGRTAQTLKEIAQMATSAKEVLGKIDVSQPPDTNDTRIMQALTYLDKVICMANAAGEANSAIVGLGETEESV